LPASILPPDKAFRKFEKFSYVPQKQKKSFANICMPKNCKMSVCPDLLALKCTKNTQTPYTSKTHIKAYFVIKLA